MTTSIPTLFISHGSPMMALEHTSTTKFLRQIAGQLPRPKAIIVASAHWETAEPMVTETLDPEQMVTVAGETGRAVFGHWAYKTCEPTSKIPSRMSAAASLAL